MNGHQRDSLDGITMEVETETGTGADSCFTQQAYQSSHDEYVALVTRHLASRVLELERQNAAMRNALMRYRANHDQRRCSDDRPCDCSFCEQARQALGETKGGNDAVE